MSCENCGSCGTENGTPKGCGDKGHCSTGGCNKLNTFNWLSDLELPDNQSFDIIEIGFKNNARKEFFKKPTHLHLILGDNVLVESTGGFDIGRVSLTGELVRLQMQKKRVRETANFPAILRQANPRDMDRLYEVRGLEKEILVQARAVARQLNLDMKIGDIEYQGDGRKLTFFYTSEGRVDFRELIRIYAKEFKVKIEMRQIGARQESARLGGIGTCGRELCCSTWLADFKSVSTVAARYQNLAINQSKLSGQCGRLKCCLNYELKTYLDALRDIPRNVERLDTERGLAVMVKMDIFKKIMYFGYKQQFGVTDIQPVPVEQVRLIHQLNKEGLKPVALNQLTSDVAPVDFAQVLNGNDQERRSRHREQGQNLHKQIAESDQTQQEDEAIVLPALQERRKKKPTNNKPKNPNQQNRVANTEKPLTENQDTENRTAQDEKPQSEDRTAQTEKPLAENQDTETRPSNTEYRKNQPKSQPNRQQPRQNQPKNRVANTEKSPTENQDTENRIAQTEKPLTEKPKNQPNRQQPRQNQPKNPNQQNRTTNTEKPQDENRTAQDENRIAQTDKPLSEKPKNQPNRQQPRQNQPKNPNQQNRTTNTEKPQPENRIANTEKPPTEKLKNDE